MVLDPESALQLTHYTDSWKVPQADHSARESQSQEALKLSSSAESGYNLQTYCITEKLKQHVDKVLIEEKNRLTNKQNT